MSGALQFKPVLFKGHLCCLFKFFLCDLFCHFKCPQAYNAEVQSSTPKRKMAVRCLLEKLRVLEKLPSGLGYCAADRNFSLNELAINILHNVFLNRNK